MKSLYSPSWWAVEAICLHNAAEASFSSWTGTILLDCYLKKLKCIWHLLVLLHLMSQGHRCYSYYFNNLLQNRDEMVSVTVQQRGYGLCDYEWKSVFTHMLPKTKTSGWPLRLRISSSACKHTRASRETAHYVRPKIYQVQPCPWEGKRERVADIEGGIKDTGQI